MSETRCRSCGATLTADAQWCSLCHTPVRVAPADLPPPTGPAVAPAAPASTAPPPGLPPPPMPVPGTAPIAAALPPDQSVLPPPAGPRREPPDADTMLAQLAAQERQERRRMTRWTAGRGNRFAIMIGGAAAIMIVLGLVMVVLTRFGG